MASWREISEFCRDVNACRELARRLFDIYGEHVNEWEMGFLEGIAVKSRQEQFTTRQVEKLLQIRDGLEPVTEIRGFSVAVLLQRCFEARLDLSEGDEQFIIGLRDATAGGKVIRRREAWRLLGCARQLNVVETAE